MFNLANAYRRLGSEYPPQSPMAIDFYGRAAKAYGDTISAEPTNWCARLNLGVSELASGNLKSAKSNLRAALAQANRIDVWDALKAARRIGRKRPGRLRKLFEAGYTPTRLAGAAGERDKRRFAHAGFNCEKLLEQVNLRLLSQMTPMIRQPAFNVGGLKGLASGMQGDAPHGQQHYVASRTAVEARLRLVLAAMPPERFAACFRAISEGLLCEVDAAVLNGRGPVQSPGEVVDYGYFLAALMLLVNAPVNVSAFLHCIRSIFCHVWLLTVSAKASRMPYR
jgi:hypothetical protein